MTPQDLFIFAVAAAGLFVIGVTRGAFGGGFGLLGIPVLSLVMDPIEAGAALAPMFVLMDMTALIFWRPSTWSKPDLAWLLPGSITGVGLGWWLLSRLDGHWIAILMAVTILAFAARAILGAGRSAPGRRSRPKALAAGLASGVTTMVAHTGGPPLAMYLLPLGLAKDVYAGTTSAFFTVGNLVKLGPWLTVARPDADLWRLMAMLAPVAPLAVWTGWKLHQRLDQTTMYRACYGLLVVTAVKLLWDGVSGLV